MCPGNGCRNLSEQVPSPEQRNAIRLAPTARSWRMGLGHKHRFIALPGARNRKEKMTQGKVKTEKEKEKRFVAARSVRFPACASPRLPWSASSLTHSYYTPRGQEYRHRHVPLQPLVVASARPMLALLVLQTPSWLEERCAEEGSCKPWLTLQG